MNLTIKCVLGQKIGDSLIRDEDGNLLSIYPDTFYERNVLGYWQLKRAGDWLIVLRFLRAE